MTHIESCLWEVTGNPTMKSMLMSSHFQDGIGKGCNGPATFKWLALIRWQTSHSDTYLAISLFILVHHRFFLRSWYILLLPGWIASRVWCASLRTSFLSWWFLGTTSRFSNQSTSCPSWRKHLYLFSPSASF